MKTIIIATRKGGVGKTILTVHTAWYYAERKHKRVVVIDLDPQENTSSTLSEYAISGVTASRLFEAADLPPIAAANPAESGNAIALIRADKKLDDFGKSDAAVIVPAFAKNLRALASSFDVAVIDTAPSAGICGIAAMIAGDAVVSPIDLETYSIQGIKDTVQTVHGIQQKYNPRLQFTGILPSRVDGRSDEQKKTLTKLVTDFGHMVLPASIKETEAIAAVPRAKIPVWRIGSSAAREHGRALLNTLALIEGKVFK